MINNVISAINSEINNYFKMKFDLNIDKLLVSQIVNQDGSIAFKGENKIICSLINIEQEKVHLNAGGSISPKINPPVDLNLYLLYSAYFSSENYDEAFKYLTNLVAFFQAKKVFTPTNTPSLSPTIDKITFEIVNLDLGELSNLWAALGAKYMPSIIYKVRMIRIDENRILEEVPIITGIDR